MDTRDLDYFKDLLMFSLDEVRILTFFQNGVCGEVMDSATFGPWFWRYL